MKKFINLTLWSTLLLSVSSCGAALFSQGGYGSDDMYGVHDSSKIIAQQQAEIAELKAKQAQYEAIIQSALQNNEVAASGTNPYLDEMELEYDSEYARKLYGFESDSYSPPSSYYSLVYSPSGELVASYDPENYNVIIDGDGVLIEPKYSASMLGYWNSTAYFSYIHYPHHRGYGWMGGFRHDPFYYSMWGYPYYSWYDWYWYGSYWNYYSPLWGWGYYPYYRPIWNRPGGGHHVAHKKPHITRPMTSSRSRQVASRYVPTTSATRSGSSSSTRTSSSGGSRYNFSNSDNSNKTQYVNSGGRSSSSSKVYDNSSSSSSSSSRNSSSSTTKSSSSSNYSRSSSSYSAPSSGGSSRGSSGSSSSFSTSGARGR
ncbi:MAG: hypothetical protein SNJ33_01215 [Rikenellaceae bacterium]